MCTIEMSAPAPEPSPFAGGLLRRGMGLLGLRRNVAVLLGMLILAGMGEKLYQRFLPKYLVALGGGPLAVGLFGFLDNALGALYALPGGRLTDRLGHRRALILFASMNLIGCALLALPYWPTVLVAMLFCSAWSQLSLPATFSLVAAELPPTKRVMGLAVQAIIRRVPMALGPVAGGAIFHIVGIRAGMLWAVAAAAILTLAAVLLQAWLSRPESKPENLAPQPGISALWRSFCPQLRLMLLSDIFIRFCEQIPNAFVILWVTERLGRSDFEFGLLTAIEMATAAALYVPVALWADSRVRAAQGTSAVAAVMERRPFVIATFMFFTAFPVALYYAAGWWSLVAAFVVRGLKEFGEPTRKAMIVDLAGDGVKASTVGLYYMIRDLTVSVAALAGYRLWVVSPDLNLWSAFACGVTGTIMYWVLSRRV
ncbi:MAG: MFS transporter [Candidatus Sumerlaeaceae bacterium]|nr:MFS transporter [Candidatus Sumerlaeaceae bacterium]